MSSVKEFRNFWGCFAILCGCVLNRACLVQKRIRERNPMTMDVASGTLAGQFGRLLSPLNIANANINIIAEGGEQETICTQFKLGLKLHSFQRNLLVLMQEPNSQSYNISVAVILPTTEDAKINVQLTNYGFRMVLTGKKERNIYRPSVLFSMNGCVFHNPDQLLGYIIILQTSGGDFASVFSRLGARIRDKNFSGEIHTCAVSSPYPVLPLYIVLTSMYPFEELVEGFEEVIIATMV